MAYDGARACSSVLCYTKKAAVTCTCTSLFPLCLCVIPFPERLQEVDHRPSGRALGQLHINDILLHGPEDLFNPLEFLLGGLPSLDFLRQGSLQITWRTSGSGGRCYQTLEHLHPICYGSVLWRRVQGVMRSELQQGGTVVNLFQKLLSILVILLL